MLPKNILSRVLDYFFFIHDNDGEIPRAAMEFLGLKNEEQIAEIKMSEMQSGILNEWLIFDYRLASGLGLIDEYEENNFVLPEDKKIYADLRQTNHYGLFEVKKVVPEISLTLQDMHSGQEYNVKEKMGTRGVAAGNLIFTRVACVNDQWQMVSAQSTILPFVEISPEIRKSFIKSSSPTIKDAYDFAADKGALEPSENINPLAARREFIENLEKYGLVKYLSINIVERWCRDMADEIAPQQIISMLIGLASEISEDEAKKLIGSFIDFYNTIKEKESPKNLAKNTPAIKIQTFAINSNKWLCEVAAAHKHMQKFKSAAAIKNFKKAFTLLQEEGAIKPDIYRMFANKAICHFNLGERYMGKKMLDMALALNPNYDFAQKMLKDYNAGKYNLAIQAGEIAAAAKLIKGLGRNKKGNRHSNRGKQSAYLRKLAAEPSSFAVGMEKMAEKLDEEELANDPATAYFNRIKKLGINLATSKLTESQISVYSKKGEKVKFTRNAFCYCGSGKKYKKCCGK